MAIDISGLLSGGSQLAAAYLPYQASQDASDALANMANRFISESGRLGEIGAEAASFKPFSITTPTGTTSVGAGGTINQQLAAQPAAIQQAMMSQAQGLAGAPTPTVQSIYDQMQAAQAGETERRRLELENRLAAQGRLGTQTAAYGGTPEALALEKAIQEQQARNMLTAQTLAPQLQGQNIQNVAGALSAAYAPQTQEFNALQNAIATSKLAQAGALGESEALYKSGIAGLTAEADLVSAQAALEAQRSRDLATALTGLFSTQGSGTTGSTPLNDLITSLLGGTPSTSSSSSSSDWLTSALGGISGFFGGATDSGSWYADSLSDSEFFDTYGYFRGEDSFNSGDAALSGQQTAASPDLFNIGAGWYDATTGQWRTDVGSDYYNEQTPIAKTNLTGTPLKIVDILQYVG